MSAPAPGLSWISTLPDPWAEAARSAAPDSPAAQAASKRRYQELQFPGLLSMLPAVSLIRLVALPACAWLWPEPGLPQLGALLMSLLGLLSLINLAVWLRYHEGTGRVAPQPVRRLICASISLSAVGYGLLVLMALPLQTEAGRIVLSVVAAAYLGGAAWMYSATAEAALGWIAGACLTLGLGLLRSPLPEAPWLAGLVPLMALFLVSMVMESRRRTLARLAEEDRVEAERQMLQLLLHDFETHANDWLWELDRDGLLRHVSVRLEDTLDRPAQALLGLPLFELLDGPSDGGLDALRERLQVCRPFADHLLHWHDRGQPRWWLLRARPLLDAGGRWAGWRGVTRDVTELELRNRELQGQALCDGLTGLPNRQALLGRLEERGPARCGLALLDLDGFRRINDELGLPGGDAVLQAVCKQLRELAGPLGLELARVAGDCFALHWQDGGIAPWMDPAQLAQRLRQAVEAQPILAGHSLRLQASVGLAQGHGEALTATELLRRADVALARAKAAGGHQDCVYKVGLEQGQRERQRLVETLREAVARDEITLVYQATWRLDNGSLAGAEALARWTPPGSEPVPPSVFVPLAESAGLILALDRSVLRRACREAAGWEQPLPVAVNVSAVQFEAPDFVAQVEQALAASGLAPERLELELTESVFVKTQAHLVERLRALRALGVGVALDDFGTGYSSLAHLQHLPLSVLKIDRAFVRQLDQADAGRARAIVATVIQLARAIGASTVAEGVETEAQRRALLELGCATGQGYLLSRPLRSAQLSGLRGPQAQA